MTETPARFAEIRFTEEQQHLVDTLCAEYDPERFIPDEMRAVGDPADWEARLSSDRKELRSQVEVAVLVGGILEGLAYPMLGEPCLWARRPDARLDLFYGMAEVLTWWNGTEEELKASARVRDALEKERSDQLADIMLEVCEAASRRALRIDQGPQIVAG